MSKSKGGNGDAKKIILTYMKSQNRPYNAQMIFDNLHGEVKKTQAQKVLTELVESGEIVEKAKGKQKIYWPNQEGLEAGDKSELDAIDAQIKACKEELKQLKEEMEQQRQRNSALNSAKTNQEVEEETERLTKENAEFEAKLGKLQGGAKLVSKADKAKAEKAYETSRAEWRRRKRICMEVIKSIGEPTNKKDKQIIEELGLETDEDAGADINGSTRTAKRRRIGDK
ncbi:PSMC3 interacting protein [Balamuthia mandrillaris]